MKKIILSIVFTISTLCEIFAQPNANTWTWVKGPTAANQMGSYGLQGVDGAANNPGARTRSITWSVNGKLYLFGGFGEDFFGDYGFMSDLWMFDPITYNWTWLNGSPDRNQYGNYGTKGVESINNAPGGRNYAVSWVANGKLYLFGGDGYAKSGSTGKLNDLWSYNLVTNKWTWLKGSDEIDKNGVYGTQGVTDAANTPGGRYGSAATLLLGKIYLMGGIGLDGTQSTSIGAMNDLWSYNPFSNNWTWLKGNVNLSPSEVAVHGTLGVEAATNTPGVRVNSITWAHNGKLYLMGGSGLLPNNNPNNNIYLSDVWEYNAITNNWKWIKGPNTINDPGTYGTQGVANPSNSPSARAKHFSWYFNNKLYMMGGTGYANNIVNVYDGGLFNDLWEFDHATNNWRWLKGSQYRDVAGSYGSYRVAAENNVPGVCASSGVWVHDEKLFLFGGQKIAGTRKSDLWEYVPSTSTEMISLKNGDWNDPLTWSLNRIPLGTDEVFINGHLINVSGNCFANKINYKNGGTLNLGSGATIQLVNF